MFQLSTEVFCPTITKPNRQLKSKIKELQRILKTLEIRFLESLGDDRKLLLKLRTDSIKMSRLEHRLEEVAQENEQLLDTVQMRNLSLNLGVSTVSFVHLQYKYDELVSAHSSLLKVLDLRNRELKKMEEQNVMLEEKLYHLLADLDESQEKGARLERKLVEVRRKKREKIALFKRDRRALGLVHDRLIAVLHKQCLEKNHMINCQLKTTQDSHQGLLFQEIRKNNLLVYENFRLQQEIGYLRAFLKVSSAGSEEALLSKSK